MERFTSGLVSPDYKQWSQKFADITEEFVWIHSGSSNGGDLTIVFRDALNALMAYKKETTNQQKIPLKESIKQAHDLAVLNGLDPWSVILRTIAERAEDWTRHISEDGEVTDDIRSWLIHEARTER